MIKLFDNFLPTTYTYILVLLKWKCQPKELDKKCLCESGIIFLKIDFGPSLAHPRTHKDRYLSFFILTIFQSKNDGCSETHSNVNKNAINTKSTGQRLGETKP